MIHHLSYLMGDKIKLFIPEIKIDKPEPQDIPLDIIYEDNYLLVINKQQEWLCILHQEILKIH